MAYQGKKRLKRIEAKLSLLITEVSEMHLSIDNLAAEVDKQTTTVAGLKVFVQGLQDQINGLQLPPAFQEKIDKIFAGVDANDQAIAAAMVNNVPTPPPVVP